MVDIHGKMPVGTGVVERVARQSLEDGVDLSLAGQPLLERFADELSE
jgi:hypothetical protein